MMKVRSRLKQTHMNSPISLFMESEGSKKRLLEMFEPAVPSRAGRLEHLLASDKPRLPNFSAPLRCSLFRGMTAGC
jgi:hypothetical protein